jgi:hypothetical protein
MNDRDYLAAHCSDDEIEARLPDTIGEVAKLMFRLGIIKDVGEKDITKAYTNRDVALLRCRLRYVYADDMIASQGNRGKIQMIEVWFGQLFVMNG